MGVKSILQKSSSLNQMKHSPPIVAALITMFATYALVILASMVLPVVAPIASKTLDIPAKYIGLYAAVL